MYWPVNPMKLPQNYSHSIPFHSISSYSIIYYITIISPFYHHSTRARLWKSGRKLRKLRISRRACQGHQSGRMDRCGHARASGSQGVWFGCVSWSYLLVNSHIAMERSTIFNGKTHYKLPFSIAMLVFLIIVGSNNVQLAAIWCAQQLQ